MTVSFDEYSEISESVDSSLVASQFSDEEFEAAEYYDIEDGEDGFVNVTVYDEDDKVVKTIQFDDWDVAVVTMEDEFDLDSLEDYDYATQD